MDLDLAELELLAIRDEPAQARVVNLRQRLHEQSTLIAESRAEILGLEAKLTAAIEGGAPSIHDV